MAQPLQVTIVPSIRCVQRDMRDDQRLSLHLAGKTEMDLRNLRVSLLCFTICCRHDLELEHNSRFVHRTDVSP